MKANEQEIIKDSNDLMDQRIAERICLNCSFSEFMYKYPIDKKNFIKCIKHDSHFTFSSWCTKHDLNLDSF